MLLCSSSAHTCPVAACMSHAAERHAHCASQAPENHKRPSCRALRIRTWTWDAWKPSTRTRHSSGRAACRMPRSLLSLQVALYSRPCIKGGTPLASKSRGRLSETGPRRGCGRPGAPLGPVDEQPVVVVEDDGDGLADDAEADPEDEVADLVAAHLALQVLGQVQHGHLPRGPRLGLGRAGSGACRTARQRRVWATSADTSGAICRAQAHRAAASPLQHDTACEHPRAQASGPSRSAYAVTGSTPARAYRCQAGT